MDETFEQLVRPRELASRDDVLARPSAIPAVPGIYSWFFKEPPSPDIDLGQCMRWKDRYLLYVGISPKKPPRNGKPPSKQNLSLRVRYHMKGNAYGSTLRMSLGCLLSSALGIQLRRVGSGTRLTFSSGERLLSEWMQDNAFVAWVPHPKPWEVEDEAFVRLYLPLNLDKNKAHPFHPVLTAARSEAMERARRLAVLPK